MFFKLYGSGFFGVKGSCLSRAQGSGFLRVWGSLGFDCDQVLQVLEFGVRQGWGLGLGAAQGLGFRGLDFRVGGSSEMWVGFFGILCRVSLPSGVVQGLGLAVLLDWGSGFLRVWDL